MHQVMIDELDDELVLSLKVQGEKKDINDYDMKVEKTN